MNIKPIVYENLTPHQRVVAAFEAMARGDKEEEDRLRETCPFNDYQMRDTAFSSTMESLAACAVEIESFLKGQALSKASLELMGSDGVGDEFLLQSMVDLQTAWVAVLAEMGISDKTMRAAMPIRHYTVDCLLADAPPPNAEAVGKFVAEIKEQVPTW